MDFQEACELINQTYVLTEREKSNFIAMARDKNQALLKVLQAYKNTKNVHEFYDSLRKNELLANQRFMKSTPSKKVKKPPSMSESQPQRSPRRSSPGKQNLGQIQKNLSLVPLQRIPLHILLKELCGTARGSCSLQKFSSVLPRLLPTSANARDPKVLGSLYNLLDANHDGNLDVNELCNSLIVFHPPDSYKQDAQLWSKISKVNWIPENRCVQNLKKLGLNERNIVTNLGGINLEGNPNLTFSQFLRAKGTQSRINLEHMFREGIHKSPVSSHSGSENLSPVNKAHSVSIMKPPSGGKKRTPSRFSCTRGSPSTPEHFPGDRRGRKQEISFCGNDVAMSSPPKIKPHPVIVRPNIPLGKQSPKKIIVSNRMRQASPFYDQENRQNLKKPLFVKQEKNSPFRQSPHSKIKIHGSPHGLQVNPQLQRVNHLHHNNHPHQRIGSPFNNVTLNRPNLITSPQKGQKKAIQGPNLKLSQSGKKGIGLNPTFLRSKDVSSNGRLRHLGNQSKTFNHNRSRSPIKGSLTPSGILNSTPLLKGNKKPIYVNSNTPRLHRPISSVIQRQSPSKVEYRKLVPGGKAQMLKSGTSPFNAGSRTTAPVVIRGNMRPHGSPTKERTPSPHCYLGRRGEQETVVKGAYLINGTGDKRMRVINPQLVVKRKLGDSAQKMKNFSDLKFHPSPEGQAQQYKQGAQNFAKGKPTQDMAKQSDQNKPQAKNNNRATYSPPKNIPPPTIGQRMDNQSTAKKNSVIEDSKKNSKKDINSNGSSMTSPFEYSKKNIQAQPNETGGQVLNSSFSKIPEMNKPMEDSSEMYEQSSSSSEVPGYFDRQKVLRKPRESNPILKKDPKSKAVVSETIIEKGKHVDQGGTPINELKFQKNKPGFQTIKMTQPPSNQSPTHPHSNRQQYNTTSQMRNPRAPQISRQYTQSYKPQNGGTAPQNGPLKFHKGKKAPGITPNPSPHKPFNPQSNLAALICSRIPLGMNNISCLEFSSFLKSYMARKKSKSLTFPQFKEMMKICKPFDIDEDIYEENLMKLFRLVDLNQNGKADRTEIANILILLTNGEKKDKIKAAFNFYDANRNGTLDREELTDYFTGVMKLKWKDTPKLMNLKEADIKLIAASTAKNCFDTIDQDGSGQVSLKEFTEWILNGGQSQATDKIRQTQFTDIHRKFEKDNALETINKIREGVPFEQIHISIAYHLLNNRTKELKALDKTQFKDFLKHLVSKTGIKVKFSDGFDNIPALFFNIFDYSNNGILDKEELGLGLFILCGKKSFNFRREKEREIEVLSSVV